MVHQRSERSRYVCGMDKKPTVTDVVVANLRSLMAETKTSKQVLSKKSGVSERMIAYILSKERTPTVDKTDALAGVFGLKGWQLQIPGIKAAIAKDGKLENLVANYNEMSDSGRQYLDLVADKEAKYRNQK